jgi:hypothetical protein
MKHVRLASLVPEFAFAALLLSQASTVAASPPSPEAAVLSQEARGSRHPTAYFSTRWRVVQVFRWCSLRRI